MAINEKRIFCPPPLGKPDPKKERPLEGVDTRSRVVQKGARNTCVEGVYNMLRDRYNAPNTSHLEERKFEKIASMRKKALTLHADALPSVCNYLSVVKQRFLEIKNTSESVFGVENVRYLAVMDHKTKGNKIRPIISDFLNQKRFKNLYDYLYFLKFQKINEIDKSFFSQLKIEPRSFFQEMQKQYPQTYGLMDWNEIPAEAQSRMIDTFAHLILAKRFGLHVSTWQPDQPIESLKEELKKHGPLTVSGRFGSAYYGVPPSTFGEIEGRTIHGWKKDDPRTELAISSHMVLIVGAEKTDKGEFVYYLDPVDESDPQHPEKQRVFIKSYKSLTDADSINDLHGYLRSNPFCSTEFAWYRPSP